jgi:membrane-associated protease RseP (regulator of RpoE activity)
MRRLLTLIILAAVAVPAAAQEVPRSARPPRPPRDTGATRTYRLDVGPEGVVYQVGRRGRLGVVVDLGADPARDSIGALINGVTPGSAADKAGVHTGDFVVKFNDTRLAGAGAADRENEEESADASRPGRRLVEMASRLHTGDTVHLELRRDGRPVTVTVVAGESGMEGMVRSLTLQPARRPLMVEPWGGAMNLMFDRAPLANLELVKVNPGLAEYFGTSEGILVVDAPAGDSALGLRAGDVILSVGGRKPNSPSHAFRILGTYDPGETVSFEVMRMKRHVTVNGKIPERHGWRAMPNSYEDFDEFVQPGWEHMDLLRGWSGIELPRMRWEPEMQLLKELPQQMIKLQPKHRTVET